MKTVKYRLTGEAPLLMHKPTLADPLNPIGKKYKEYSKKRTKTDDDLLIMRKIQWQAGLYYNDKIGYHIPSEMIHACLIGGAKKFKLGTAFKSCLIANHSKLQFEHSKLNPDQLYELDQYIDTRMVVVNRSRVTTTRPIFTDWSLEIEVIYDESLFNIDEIDKVVNAAGKFAALGDYRPQYGRFESQRI